MRKFLKNNILEIFDTIYSAHKTIKKLAEKKDYDTIIAVLSDCQNTAIQIGNVIEESEGEGFITVSYLEKYCEEIYNIAQNLSSEEVGSKIQKSLDKTIMSAESSVKNDIKVKLEVVFCPYNASMWDSLESIWKAANDDPDCNAYVVVAPYYDRNPDHSFGKFHYEADKFPDYVPIIHYESFDFEKIHPDIVYIQNPYDDNNFVTSVDPKFYSFNLKKYTDCLIYVPYHISGTFCSDTAKNNIFSAFLYADKIILPSEKQKLFYMSAGLPESRFEVLGNPKFDFIVNELDNIKIPEEWINICENKKVFLLNSTISKLLSDENWSKNTLSLIENFKDSSDCVLIWRPHPLLKATIESMRPDKIKEFNHVVNVMNENKNIIIDTTPSVFPAIKISNALISDYSSIIMQYSLTGKPALITVGKTSFRNTRVVCFDYFSNYFIRDGVTVDDFITMIKENKDERKEERIRTMSESVVNIDGTSGIKIHNKIKETAMR